VTPGIALTENDILTLSVPSPENVNVNVKYRWFQNYTLLKNENKPTLVKKVQLNDAGSYHVMVQSATAFGESSHVFITVRECGKVLHSSKKPKTD